MLLVETYLAPSTIHGIGLFAAQDIAAGELVWRMDQRIDLVFSQRDIGELPPAAVNCLHHYAYYCRRNKVWILCGDNGRFFNHSDGPNTREDYTVPCPFGVDFSARDIVKGEELTTDYRGFDEAADMKL